MTLQPADDVRAAGERLAAALCLLRLDDPGDPQSFRVFYANRAAARAWQVPLELLVGKPLLEAFPALVGTDVACFFRDVLLERRGAMLDSLHYAGDDVVGAGCFSLEAFPLGDDQLAVVFERHGAGALSPWHLRHLAAIVDSSWDAVLGKTLGGTITSWNRAAAEMYGYTSEEAVGRSIDLIVPDDRRAELDEILAAVRRGEYVDELETVRVTKDGRRIAVRLRVSPIRDEEGTIVGASATARDVTEQQQLAARLREEQELFRVAFDEASVAMWLTTPEGRFVRVNQAACELIGYSKEELESLTLFDISLPEEHELLREHRDALESGAVTHLRLEKRYVRKNGELLWTEITGSRVHDATGGVRYFLGQVQDISARRAAEEQLRRSRSLYQTVVEHSRDLISLLDLDGRYVFVSGAHERLLGYEPDELVGRPVFELMHPDDASMARVWLEREGAGETPSPPVRLRCADGSYLSVESRATVVRGTDGEPLHVLAVSRDLTPTLQRRELEARLRQAEKLEAVGQLAGGIAHDFNNLLTVIRGYEEIARRSDDEALRADALDQIRRAADDAAQLTSQLLAFGSRQVLRPEVLDLNTVVREYQPMLDRLLGDHVEVRLWLAPDVGRIRADRAQVGQVLVNLAVNARDAMPDGGTITIETAASVDDDRPYVRLTVADTGVGIDPDVVPLLFDPFFTTKPKGHGTGLGLASVFGIVNQSGGRISVSSDLGRGAAFSILFPGVDDPLPVPAPRRSRRTPAPRDVRVLVVDDNDLVRPLVETMVAAGGYEVVALDDPRTALALPERETRAYDVLVTDLSMPNLGGVELARALHAAWPALKVLYASGYADTTTDVAGPDARFLQKPFDADELLDAIAELLGTPPTA